jgi:hypothetical protein
VIIPGHASSENGEELMAASPADYENDVAMLNAVKSGRMSRAMPKGVTIDGVDVSDSPTYIALVRRHLIDVLGADRPRLTERGLAELARLES